MTGRILNLIATSDGMCPQRYSSKFKIQKGTAIVAFPYTFILNERGIVLLFLFLFLFLESIHRLESSKFEERPLHMAATTRRKKGSESHTAMPSTCVVVSAKPKACLPHACAAADHARSPSRICERVSRECASTSVSVVMHAVWVCGCKCKCRSQCRYEFEWEHEYVPPQASPPLPTTTATLSRGRTPASVPPLPTATATLSYGHVHSCCSSTSPTMPTYLECRVGSITAPALYDLSVVP
jgi:hypothetical protein